MISTATNLTIMQFPDDAVTGRKTFLDLLTVPAELWLRSYALTMPEAAGALSAAHKAGYARHLTVDHSQMADPVQTALVRKLVAEGLEITITTSYAFTGSTNWSPDAWLQINKSLAFNSLDFLAQFRASFAKSVAYAWTNQKAMQLMAAPPAWLGA